MQDETQNPGAEAGDAEIEMPPDPLNAADAAALANAAADAASAIDDAYREAKAIADEDWF